jgi:hypothetical protein
MDILQHGADKGQGDVALLSLGCLGQQEYSVQMQTHQAVASATPANAARNSGKATTSSDGIIVQTIICGFDCRDKIK